MQYAIYEGNLEKIRSKVTRIRNKCRKYGTEFRFEEVGEEFRTFEGEHGETITRRFVIVEAEGVAKINGWRFIASVDHTENGNIINKAVADVEIPERYYNATLTCEHCGTPLKYAFIVMSDGGEFKMVGRSCLKDFTGGMSAEGVAHYASLFDDLIESEEPHTGGGYAKEYIARDEWLAYVAETVRIYGYVKSDGYSGTRSKAMDFYKVDHHQMRGDYAAQIRLEEDEIGFNPKNPESIAMANEALAWIADQPEENNFMHNLKVACSLKWLDYSHTGITAALFPTWRKDLERQEVAKRERASEWVGTIGERITIAVADYYCVTSWETQWGWTGIYKITDTDGNVYTWKTSGDIPEGTTTIKATVKEHSEYRDVKQTEITRCKCTRG